MAGKAAEWFMGKVGEKPKKRDVDLKVEAPTRAQIDDVEAMLDRTADDGKKLAAGVKAASSAAERLAECGLTPDAIILLVQSKCRWTANGKQVSYDTVEIVLEAFFRIGEHHR